MSPGLLSLPQTPCFLPCPFLSLTFYTLQFLGLLILIPLGWGFFSPTLSVQLELTKRNGTESYKPLLFIDFLPLNLFVFLRASFLPWIAEMDKINEKRELTKKINTHTFLVMKILQWLFSLGSIKNASLQIPVTEGLRQCDPDDAEYDAENKMYRVKWLLALTDGTFFSFLGLFFLKNKHFYAPEN